jgi:uncharacterized membrane protein YqgA involved in biofilm formation
VTGTILNVAGILIGGTTGLLWRQSLSPTKESYFKVTLSAFTVFYGLRLTWMSLNGSIGQILKQLLIVVLALMLGRLTGQGLRLQRASNRFGQWARASIETASSRGPTHAGDGFKTCALLFCAAPLGILGSIQDGLSEYFYPLAVKGVVEGLATMGLVPIFGWGVMLAAVPVLALQGTLTLACMQYVEPFLRAHKLVDSVNATGGLLVFCVALVMLGLKRVALADYLPSLAFAALITWLWR